MNEDFKTIKIKYEIWKKLNYLKLEKETKTISEVIAKLIETYEKGVKK